MTFLRCEANNQENKLMRVIYKEEPGIYTRADCPTCEHKNTCTGGREVEYTSIK